MNYPKTVPRGFSPSVLECPEITADGRAHLARLQRKMIHIPQQRLCQIVLPFSPIMFQKSSRFEKSRVILWDNHRWDI